MSKTIESKFQAWWKVPKHRVWTIRVAIFISQALLILGVAIFMWLNFAN